MGGAVTVLALVVTLLSTVNPEPASAVTLPNDVGGHQHVAGLLDVSEHRCGTLVRGADANGRQLSPTNFDYTIPSNLGNGAANAIDHHWVQDEGGSGLADALVYDLDEPTLLVDLFPSIDHGPVPGEALESTVYGFDRLTDPPADWETGDISLLFDQGWSDWISDDFVARWNFSQPHRYVAVRWGGPKAVLSDGDNEIDAVCAPAAAGVAARGGPDQTVPEGSVVTLDGGGSLGFTDGGLTYAWELVTSTGPPITLSTAPLPALVPDLRRRRVPVPPRRDRGRHGERRRGRRAGRERGAGHRGRGGPHGRRRPRPRDDVPRSATPACSTRTRRPTTGVTAPLPRPSPSYKARAGPTSTTATLLRRARRLHGAGDGH